jgi:putative transposase
MLFGIILTSNDVDRLRPAAGGESLKAAAKKVIGSSWQRCRVHFMRNALAHVGIKQRAMVAAAIRTVFVQEIKDDAYKEL